MIKIAILLSSFNGEKFITEQIESLQKLELVESIADIYIRDDGSNDKTVEFIKKIIDENKNEKINIILEEGKNVGVVKSFFCLIKICEEHYDYIAFCDQDDVWMPQKISKAVNILYDYKDIPAMQFSRLEVVDKDLNHLFFTAIPKKDIGLGNSLVENIATGCTIVINNQAFKLLKANLPNSTNIVMHDWWIYLTISAIGKVIFNPSADIKYRQHSSNVEGMKSGVKNILNKFIKMRRGSKYPRMTRQIEELMRCYSKKLNREQIELIRTFTASISTPLGIKVIYLIMSHKVYRQTFNENLSLIFSILAKRL